MFINDGILYYTIDVCRKQYICANAMWLLSVLEFTYKVNIYTYINYTSHGIRTIYVIDEWM